MPPVEGMNTCILLKHKDMQKTNAAESLPAAEKPCTFSDNRSDNRHGGYKIVATVNQKAIISLKKTIVQTTASSVETPIERGSFTPLGGRFDHTGKAPEKVLSCKGMNPKETLSGPPPPLGKAWCGRNSSHPWQFDLHKAGDSQVSSTICPSEPIFASVVPGKLSVTGSSRSRRHPCRLPRCEAILKDVNPRCRGNSCSRSLSSSQVGSQVAGQGKQKLEGVLPVKSSGLALAAPRRCSRRNHSGFDVSGTEKLCAGGLQQCSLLSTTRRDNQLCQRRPGSSNGISTEGAGDLHFDDSTSGATKGVKGPNPRRHCDRRQTRWAWRDLWNFESGKSSTCPAVRPLYGRLLARLDRRLSAAWVCSSPISTQARSQLGHSQQGSEPRKHRVSMQVETCKNTQEICKSRQHTKGFTTTSNGNENLVLWANTRHALDPPADKVNKHIAKGAYGGESCSVSSSSGRGKGLRAVDGGGFMHVMKQAPICHGAFFECCAGSCRLAQSCAIAGTPSESYEISRDKREDICSGTFRKNLKSRIANKSLAALRLGITCASFTLARRGNIDYSGWPPPLRSNDPVGIYGLPNLSEKDQERVRLGNRLARRAAAIIQLCIKANIPVFLENPASSRLWIFPRIPRLLTRVSQFKIFHQCQYDSPHKKQTKLAMWNFEFSQLAKKMHRVPDTM